MNSANLREFVCLCTISESHVLSITSYIPVRSLIAKLWVSVHFWGILKTRRTQSVLYKVASFFEDTKIFVNVLMIFEDFSLLNENLLVFSAD